MLNLTSRYNNVEIVTNQHQCTGRYVQNMTDWSFMAWALMGSLEYVETLIVSLKSRLLNVNSFVTYKQVGRSHCFV